MKPIFSFTVITACVGLITAFPAAAQDQSPDTQPGAGQLLKAPTSDLRIKPEKLNIKNPYSGDKNAVAAGKVLFASMNCVGCHAPYGGGGMGPSLSDNLWIYGNQPADIYLTIAQGRPNGMPAWGKALPPQSIWSIVAYVKTLSR